MRTIRKNVFETNSSSTHSISIIDSSTLNQSRPISDNSFIYPSRLNDYSFYIESGEGGHSLKCNTSELKSAIVLHWILSLKIENQINSELCDKLQKLIADNLGLEIDWENSNYPDYHPYSEYDRDNTYNFDLCNSDEEFIDKIKDLIDIINDYNVMIVDEDIPW